MDKIKEQVRLCVWTSDGIDADLPQMNLKTQLQEMQLNVTAETVDRDYNCPSINVDRKPPPHTHTGRTQEVLFQINLNFFKFLSYRKVFDYASVRYHVFLFYLVIFSTTLLGLELPSVYL
jgi:hypothetical protein